MGLRNEDDESEDSEDRDSSSEKKKKSKKHKKESRKHKKSDRKRRRREEYSESDSDSDDEDARRRRKKDSKRKHKKSEKRRRTNRDEDNKQPTELSPNSLHRNDNLARALVQLLEEKPDFASELPIILIRLAGGATFDLSQMTDFAVARGLQKLFESISAFGVEQNEETKLWMFKAPNTGNRDELVLLRVVRSLLNEIGITMEGIQDYETRRKAESQKAAVAEQASKTTSQSSSIEQDEVLETLKNNTRKILVQFNKEEAQLNKELGSLCRTIADGESISLDDLPDAQLKDALESLFVLCGLEKSEMENHSDDEVEEQGEDEGPLMGYGLPQMEAARVQAQLAAIMEACRNPTISNAEHLVRKQHMRGPMRKEDAEASDSIQIESEEEDDEGPAPVGVAKRRVRGPVLPPEFNATAAGASAPTKEGEREEWMLVPGEHDFLSSIKSGQASRNFQNKKSRDNEEGAKPINPAIQAEMDAIMKAHADARGPSLVDQHREKKKLEKEAAADTNAQWKWSRDDLDAGRRVDKDALHMVLGGAADNLKTKFQGGFNR
jgi:hypothetical protein